MNVLDQNRLLEALEASPGPMDSPSDAIMKVLREFAEDGKIREVAEGYKEFRRQRQPNAERKLDQIIAMLWKHWDRHGLVVDHYGWTQYRPTWSQDLRQAIILPDLFVSLVEEMDAEITGNFSKPAVRSSFTSD